MALEELQTARDVLLLELRGTRGLYGSDCIGDPLGLWILRVSGNMQARRDGYTCLRWFIGLGLISPHICLVSTEASVFHATWTDPLKKAAEIHE